VCRSGPQPPSRRTPALSKPGLAQSLGTAALDQVEEIPFPPQLEELFDFHVGVPALLHEIALMNNLSVTLTQAPALLRPKRVSCAIFRQAAVWYHRRSTWSWNAGEPRSDELPRIFVDQVHPRS
jgi:hypothetical protein